MLTVQPTERKLRSVSSASNSLQLLHANFHVPVVCQLLATGWLQQKV